MSDFYALLGVPRDCTEAEIKKAYRKLAMEYHPDRNSSAGAEAKFKEITEAYEVLRDPQKRAAYDRYGKAGVGGPGGFGFHHVDLSEALNIFMRDFGNLGAFESIFGGGGRRQDPRRGQDVRVTVRLSLADVASGDAEGALKAIDRESDAAWRRIGLPIIYHALGRHAESDAALAELIRLDEAEGSYNIAQACAFRGEVDRAFEWLDKAIGYQDAGLNDIIVDPQLAKLRDDPRWAPLLERLGRSPERMATIPFEVNLPP